ncbi:unnamed protein product [Microthlaspi erraticum]|uniref:Bifunctional inhibitor/plant lipid transfer protein/seed storage helical domain-containing protein n=1 Tax=Microthlaspi erraticum TaxID=1685480 RepID=A0A6D2HXX8_9BRAS|nr:unnamed protein product [Microthlaspi erraticum]
MGKNNTRMLMRFSALVIVLTVAIMVEETKSVRVCNIETNDLERCRPAVTGNNPPPPVNGCCVVLRAANLRCFCQFKSYATNNGIDPAKAKALIPKCGIRNVIVPPGC